MTWLRRSGRIALWVLAAVGALVLLLPIGVAVVVRAQDPAPPPHAVLWLDLTGPLEEKPSTALIWPGETPPPRLLDVVAALRAAATDPRITAVVAEIGPNAPDPGRSQELRAAVAAFRASGKPTIAWAEDLGWMGNGTLGYYLPAPSVRSGWRPRAASA